MIAWNTWSSLKKVAFVGLMAFVIIIIILFAGISWILISPLFLEGETLNEELPDTIGVVDNSTVTTDENNDMQNTSTVMKNETITKTDSNTSSSQFTLISQGELQRLDSFHHGSGIVQLVKNNETGRYSIFFRDVVIANGPGLVVYLTTGYGFTGTRDDIGNYADLGDLRANIGNFSMDVPEDVDPTEYKAVTVWCDPASIIFTYATLNSTG